MERRKLTVDGKPQVGKPTSLPLDYLKMVNEVFTTNFDEGLKALRAIGLSPRFQSAAELYADEVILGLSLVFDGKMAATTVYASADFDPAASSPTIEDLLSACVDGIASILQVLLDAKDVARLEALAAGSMSAMEEVPYKWMAIEIAKRPLFIRVDKANPDLEQATDAWLAANDPEHGKAGELDEEEAQSLAEERVDALLEEKAGIRRRTH
ncbi:MAG: hypothetical protein IT285_02255 [Bdellovibrionales bacterium]|nr:hypothetical protein [Bdellovibrionales bacterium]